MFVLRLSADEYVERACGVRPRTTAERVRLYDQLCEERAALRAEMKRHPRGPSDPLRTACFRAEVALFALGRADLAATVAGPEPGAWMLCYAAYDLLPVPPDLPAAELGPWISAHASEIAWDPTRRRYGFAVQVEDWVLTPEARIDCAGAVRAVLGGERFDGGEQIYAGRHGDVRVDGTRRDLASVLDALCAHTGTKWSAARKTRTRIDHASRTYRSTSITRPSLIAARG